MNQTELLAHQTDFAISMTELYNHHPELDSLMSLIPGGIPVIFQACSFNLQWGMVTWDMLDKHIQSVTYTFVCQIENQNIDTVIKAKNKILMVNAGRFIDILTTVITSICHHLFRMLGSTSTQYQMVERVRWLGHNPILTIGTYDRATHTPVSVPKQSALDSTGHQSVYREAVRAARAAAVANELDPNLMVLELYWRGNPESGQAVQS